MDPISAMRSMVNSMHMVHAVNLGVDLGLFQSLASCDPPVSVDRYMGSIKYPELHVRPWLHAVQAAGVITIDASGRVNFGEGWREALTDTNSDSYIPPMLTCHMAIAEMYAGFAGLFEKKMNNPLRTFGGETLERISEDGIRFANFFLRKGVGRIPGLEKKLMAGIKVYDVGCGTGQFLLKIAQAYPKSQFIGIDQLPAAIERAEARARRADMQDRVIFLNQCATECQYDDAELIILNEVLHEMDEHKRLEVLRAICSGLRRQGSLFLVDILLPDEAVDYSGPGFHLSALVSFFEMPWGSKLLTRGELGSLLSKAGFGDLNHIASADNVVAAYVRPRR